MSATNPTGTPTPVRYLKYISDSNIAPSMLKFIHLLVILSLTAYKDSQPPPYYFVVGGPEMQQPETWNLPTDGTLLIQRA